MEIALLFEQLLFQVLDWRRRSAVETKPPQQVPCCGHASLLTDATFTQLLRRLRDVQALKSSGTEILAAHWFTVGDFLF